MTTVYFSPNGGCLHAILALIQSAGTSILLRGYSFTSEPIAEALVEAHLKRKVLVEPILDYFANYGNKQSKAGFLACNGIDVYLDKAHAIAHDKIMVIDGSVVITGSYNWTDAAEHHNAENLIVIPSQTLAVSYTANHEQHRAHSILWVPGTGVHHKDFLDDELREVSQS